MVLGALALGVVKSVIRATQAGSGRLSRTRESPQHPLARDSQYGRVRNTEIILLCYITQRLYNCVVWEIEVSLIEKWLLGLSSPDYDLVLAALEILESEGPTLGRPLVDSIAHSQIKNLKELRPGSSGRTEIRILFVFDPSRKAVMLVAGDKSGSWNEWYKRNIPLAQRRYRDYLNK